jgi:hypothetical protein
MSEIKYAAESGHWYDRAGNPAYTVIGKNGKERNTTLRDARTMDLLPSVTTVMRVAASPGLDRWKQEQVLMAALTLPKRDGETEGEWMSRIMEDSKETGRQAANRGTEIHGAIERHYRGLSFDSQYDKHVEGCVMAINSHFNDWEWEPEKSFACSLGFGGKVDMHTNGIVVDIKTKEFGPDDKIAGYDEHMMQLAAYRYGLEMPVARCANVFVSRSHPGLVHVVEWSQDDLNQGWEMFAALLRFWQIKNNYGG